MLTIGCHLSSSKGYEAMARAAASIDANTFQFFTRNPRGGKAKAIDPADVAAFERRAAEEDIDVILAHAPYTLNPAAADGRVRDFARATFADDLVRMEATPGQLYNFHPGSHVKQGAEVGIATRWSLAARWACAWIPAMCGTRATTSRAIWTACSRSSTA